MTADEVDDGRRRRARWLRIAAGLAVVALAVFAGRALLAGSTPPEAPADGPKLHRWELVGCYDLRSGPWTVQWRDDETGGTGRSGERETPTPSGDAAPEDREAGGRASPGARSSAGRRLPPAFSPPGKVVLLPDSADRWGRVLPSRRAEPLEGGDDHPGRTLRWLVRADTLWVLWSEEGTRAGVALRRSGDSLAGRVRTVRGGDSLDATARASARRINCWSRAPSSGSRPSRQRR